MEIPLDVIDWDRVVENAGETLYIADLGCGKAEYHDTLLNASRTMAEREGYTGEISITGIEQEPEKVEKARQNNPGHNFNYIEQELEPEQTDKFNENSYDIVLSQCLMCDTEDEEGIKEVIDGLRKDSGYNSHHTTC